MVYINPDTIPIPQSRLDALKQMTQALCGAPKTKRPKLIKDGRNDSWAHDEVVEALRHMVGNKCWYSEVHLDHNDPDVDHFRPKGSIREIEPSTREHCGRCEGYWWLAFEPRNFRLAAVHANRRRVFVNTNGGKWDYFPVIGDRAKPGTPWKRITEEYLPLDPCRKSDVLLLWFDADGVAGVAKEKKLSDKEKLRVDISIWLYHLDEENTQKRRGEVIRGVLADLDDANDEFKDWDHEGACNEEARKRFDDKIALLEKALNPKSLFAGAVGRVVRTRSAHYPWILDYLTLP
jgi:hypothetical protein